MPKPSKKTKKKELEQFLDANINSESDSEYEGGLNLTTINSDSELQIGGVDPIEDTNIDDTNIDDTNIEIDIEEFDKQKDTIDDLEENEEEQLYKYANKDLFVNSSLIKENIILTGNDRITRPILTKYERVRLIAERTKHLSLGAKPMIKNTDGLSAQHVAELELEKDVIPIIIIRPLPNNITEQWKVTELKH